MVKVFIVRVRLVFSLLIRVVHVFTLHFGLASCVLVEELVDACHNQVDVVLDAGWSHLVCDVADTL